MGGDEVGEDGDGGYCPEGDGDPGELEEAAVGVIYLCLQEVDFLVERDLLAVHLVGVDDELGNGLLVLLAGVVEDGDVCLVFLAGFLEDADSGFDFGLFAFVLDDAPHGVGDICQGVFVGLVELGVPAVDPVAEVAGLVLQCCDVVVDAGDVVDDALVVVDNALDCGVAVCPAGGAVAFGLGGHCVVLTWVVWLSLIQLVDELTEPFLPLLSLLFLLLWGEG